MKTTTTRVLSLVAVLTGFLWMPAKAQNWNLIWADEFTNGYSSDWVFETGAGGWGNNELEYYQQQNATVSNGVLSITARQESNGTITSARMKTQGRFSFTYGRVEARIQMPSFMGSWPAFWMLGESIGSKGWPACGEIDIMEHINTAPEVHGTIHWAPDGDAGYGNYGDASWNIDVTQWHTYAIEWDANAIRWYLDGTQYHEVSIAGGVNGTSEFHQDFFLLLNVAVGGNWPGFNIDYGGMPAAMRVDYVRVYQAGGSNPPPTGNASIPGTIEAESYSLMQGVQLEACSEGGQNVGYIDAADWMLYNVNVAEAGNYQVEYRVASATGGGVINLEQNSGTTLLGSVNVPNTGGWQNWTTVSHTVSLNAGSQEIAIGVPVGGYNLNWIKFTKVGGSSGTPIFIEAEGFANMSGIQTEACAEGGQNVGWIDQGDWILYNANVPAGNYQVNYRVASQNGGGTIQLEKQGGSPIYGQVGVPNTGGWQNWTTVSHQVNINENLGQIALAFPSGGFNLNWFELVPLGSRSATEVGGLQLGADVKVYPNPTAGELRLQGLEQGWAQATVLGLDGKVYQQQSLAGKLETTLEVSDLRPGMYLLRLENASGAMRYLRFVKE